MFKCAKCQVLEDEITFLREANTKLTNQLVAIVSPQAFDRTNYSSPQGDYYGDGNDQYVSHDAFGLPVLVEKRPEEDK